MGEKDFTVLPIWNCFLTNGNKTVKFDGLSTADFIEEVKDTDEDEKEYTSLMVPKTASFTATINGTISRKSIYMLFVSGGKRAIRRAIRWEEKLRRMGYPKEGRIAKAASKANWAQNNGNRRKKLVEMLIRCWEVM